MLNFMVSGSFAGLTEQEIASALVLRFQRVGPNGELSDVAVAGSPVRPHRSALFQNRRRCCWWAAVSRISPDVGAEPRNFRGRTRLGPAVP